MKTKPTWLWFFFEINDIERLEIKVTSEEQAWRALKILHPSPIKSVKIVWRGEKNYFEKTLDN